MKTDMKLSQKQLAVAFSNGEFEKTYPYLSETVVWDVIDSYQRIGKMKVMEQCEKVAQYFASITTDFIQTDLIEGDNKVVVTGTAELSKDGKQIEFISSCDIYVFNINNQLLSITSYCMVKAD